MLNINMADAVNPDSEARKQFKDIYVKAVSALRPNNPLAAGYTGGTFTQECSEAEMTVEAWGDAEVDGEQFYLLRVTGTKPVRFNPDNGLHRVMLKAGQTAHFAPASAPGQPSQ